MDREKFIPDDLGARIKLAKQKAGEMGLPHHPLRRRQYLERMAGEVGAGSIMDRLSKLSGGAVGGIRSEANATPNQMGSGGSVRSVWPKRYDPLASPTNRNIPFYSDEDAYDDDEVIKVARAWCRFYYATHHLVPTCIDIFASFPTIGYEHSCKDEGITRFYDDLFIDDLNYPEKIKQIGLEYWKVGEVFPMCEWNDSLGIITNEEIMNPDDIIVEQNLMLKSTKYKFRIPEYMKELVERNGTLTEDRYEDDYSAMLEVDPEFVDMIRNNEFLEINSDNIDHLKHGGNPWSPRGYPILMRAFRQLLLEERLNRAQLAISERLYTPLIMLLLGKENLGENGEPWIPQQQDINRTQVIFENMMESEYRTLVHHFGLQVQVPFSGERLPNLDLDYQRVSESLLGVFGISRDLLYGGKGQNYASTALSAEFLMQKLKTYQNMMKTFIQKRYERVARAQGFYDYEMKGGRKIDLTEQVKILQPGGGYRIETRKKLLIPDVRFLTMDFRQEDVQRTFLQTLKTNGVFISDSRMAQGIELDEEAEMEKTIQEQVQKAIAGAQIRKAVREEAARNGLTQFLDPDWVKPTEDGATNIPGVNSEGTDPGDPEDPDGEDKPGASSDKSETDTPQSPVKTRPEQSDERRGDMPKQTLRQRLRRLARGEQPTEGVHNHYENALYGEGRKRVLSALEVDGYEREDEHP